MGWQIAEMENTVKISKAVAKELFAAQAYEEEIWYSERDVTHDGLLYFNIDHLEHMDYLHYESIQKVLKKNKVKGRVCFGSLEGDNAGSFWGYEFDGKGGMTPLYGEVVWKSDK